MRWFARLLALALAGCAAAASKAPARSAGSMSLPQYTERGELVRPEGYESWVFVGASIGLSYSENSKHQGPGEFHNVFTQPEAFEAYRSSGRFPEKTMFILTLHEPKERESIAKQGYFEGDLVALEASVKDRERFQEGWAYFDFGKGGLDPSAPAKPPEKCHACHAAHAAADNVFVQFYSPLRGLREARGPR